MDTKQDEIIRWSDTTTRKGHQGQPEKSKTLSNIGDLTDCTCTSTVFEVKNLFRTNHRHFQMPRPASLTIH